MAKILIAGIGGGEKRDGKYRETNYSLEGKVYENRSFIASVIEEHFKIDKTIFIGTVGSMWDNLYEYYCKKYNIDYDEEYAMSLFETIVEANKDMDISQLKIEKFNNIFNGKIEGRVTKYGVDSEQIFDNFNIILNLQDTLKDGDEVYIDITHSFRSNAMWMFLVMNFITDLMDKNIEIKMISYGMFEIADRTSNITPIIDLNAFYKLLKWIKGAQSFKNYGNSYLLLDNIENEELRGVFNLVAPQAVSQSTFTRAMGKAYHAWTTLIVPQTVFRLLYGEAASFLTAGQSVRPTRLLEAGFHFSVPTIEKLFEETDHSTVDRLDLKRYMGLWYEIARYDHRFERGLMEVTATYTLRSDGTIRVENRGYKRNSPYDICKTATGHAKIPDPAQPGKLKVSFFLNFYSDYYVMELDQENYNYALIGSSTDKYLWILSRTPQLPEDIKKKLVTAAERRGYDTNRLQWIEQL